VLVFKGLQHFLIAQPPADLLPPPPVKPSLVAIDSGHFYLLALGPVVVENLKSACRPHDPN
jgi:hypothetical protein